MDFYKVMPSRPRHVILMCIACAMIGYISGKLAEARVPVIVSHLEDR